MSLPFGYALSSTGPLSPFNPPHTAPPPTPAQAAWRFHFGQVSHFTWQIAHTHKAPWRTARGAPSWVWNNTPLSWAFRRGAASAPPDHMPDFDQTNSVFGYPDTHAIAIPTTGAPYWDPYLNHPALVWEYQVPHDPYGESAPPLRIGPPGTAAGYRTYPT